MAKGRKAAAAAPVQPTEEAGPYVPDAAFQPIAGQRPKLDVSEAGLDGDQELWLLQLPLDFPTGVAVEWCMCEDAGDGVRGRCTIHGVEYLLVPEQEALSAAVYATPASPKGSLVPVARRMNVVRATKAPELCFGQGAAAAAGGGKRQRRPQAAGAAGAAAAPGAQQQQHQQQQQPEPATEQKQKKKKRKASEAAEGGAAAEAAAAAEAGGSEKKRKEKKDKSAKKEKKDKSAKKKAKEGSD